MNKQTVVVIAYNVAPKHFSNHLKESGFLNLIRRNVQHGDVQISDLKPIIVTDGGSIISLNPDFKPAAFDIYFEGNLDIPEILGNIADECLKACQIRPLISHDSASPGDLFNLVISEMAEDNPDAAQHLIHEMALQPNITTRLC